MLTISNGLRGQGFSDRTPAGDVRGASVHAQGAQDTPEAAMASLAQVLPQAPVALVAYDAAGRIALVAGGEVGRVGLAGGAVIGQHACDVWRHAPAMVTALRSALDGVAARVALCVGARTYDVSLAPCRSGETVVGAIGVAVDVTARVDIERVLRHRATHDALTQLPNRALYADRLDQALRASARAGSPVSVVLLDLDGFKEVNDTHGHATGDAVLVEVARRLAHSVRASDTVARLGGDEFGIVLPATDSLGTTRLIGQIRANLAAMLVCNGVEARVGVSIGAATWPEHGTDAASLLGHADAALYQSKRTGARHGRRGPLGDSPRRDKSWIPTRR